MNIDAPNMLAGYLMEYNATHAIVFNTKELILKRGLLTHEPIPLQLATWYDFRHLKQPRQNGEQSRLENFEFFVGRQNTEVYARSWAVSPGEELPMEVREKYKGKVWAPYFGLLNDTNGMFERKFGKGGIGSIVVRYVNRSNEVFELEQVDDRQYNFQAPNRPAPWNQPALSNYYDAFPSRLDKVCARSCARFALCVCDGAVNYAQNKNHHGSTEACARLVSSSLGVIRSCYEAEIGNWYQHSVNDQKESKHNLYMRSNAYNLQQIEPPLPTEVVDCGNDVEVTATFIFDHNHFEEEWSHEITDWEERKTGIQPKVIFYNVYLGKVRIPKHLAIQVIKLVESLQRDCYERLKTDPITVIVKVRLFDNYLKRNNKNPGNELYVVTSVVDVEYLE
ncbi:hypothetical protein CRE_29113 [Caenorhabditis remanei]|uniref:Uncharacterized protein n=1 Tax=Caenorhabditis remanei TaxID=31234 RepID=E3N4L4_CAERE|nr:hypothetical protein CRE_29113 [Caenorhabditis remanei]